MVTMMFTFFVLLTMTSKPGWLCRQISVPLGHFSSSSSTQCGNAPQIFGPFCAPQIKMWQVSIYLIKHPSFLSLTYLSYLNKVKQINKYIKNSTHSHHYSFFFFLFLSNTTVINYLTI